MKIDTVKAAAQSPDQKQPHAVLGLRGDEYQRIKDILGRRPTSAELAIYSVMWSEHCSYKSSKVHLRMFGELPPSERLMVGIGENAGVVDIGDGYAVTFKAESHNHPSYVEPYQGAATGVGGIVRDILTMGARPLGVMDPLRFGPAEAADTARVLPGVVAGVGGYGNCLGLPNIGGEVVFDDCYAGNPLVNVLCVGVMRHEDIKLARAPGPGNVVVIFGSRTGPDGIGGASILASEAFDGEKPKKRPSVQVGDPFTEKLLIECCLEIFAADLVVGIQDFGAAGLSCVTSELASAGAGGMHVVLDDVPLRDQTMTCEEILMSESQERMCAIVEPDKIEAFLALCAKWEVLAAVIGTVNDSGRLTVEWHGEQIVDVPPRTVAHDGPVYQRPLARPSDQDALQSDFPDRLARPESPDQLRDTLLCLVSHPNLADKSWVTEQYDSYVRGNTVLSQPEDAGVLRIDEQTHRGIALSTDGNGRYGRLDPYAGAQLAVAEAYRNVAATGATPIAITDCLNFGSPEEPGVMWQFAEAIRGIADACRELGLPVTGGNVSFYNQTGNVPVHPTPVIGVLGVIDDVRRRLRHGLGSVPAEEIAVIGETRAEFGGSQWAGIVHAHLGGMPPLVDLAAEARLAAVLVRAAQQQWLTAAHDVSDGGLAATLTESVLRYGVGARIRLPGDPFVELFSESGGRALVAGSRGGLAALEAACAEVGVPMARIGTVGGDELAVEGVTPIPIGELRAAWTETLPRLFGTVQAP